MLLTIWRKQKLAMNVNKQSDPVRSHQHLDRSFQNLVRPIQDLKSDYSKILSDLSTILPRSYQYLLSFDHKFALSCIEALA